MDRDVITALGTSCREAGLDIVHPFRLDWFNRRVEPSLRLPDGNRPEALGLLVGNTRHLWPVFTAAVRARPELLASDHPLDSYVEDALGGAVARRVAERYVIWWAHRMAPAAIPIQQIAQASGLAHLSPSHLSVHRLYGPWIALRAVVVVDAEGPPGEGPRAYDPCTVCSKPCIEPFQRAVRGGDAGDEVEQNWKSWAVIREVCPEGRAYRYGDEQLEYHYNKNPKLLRSIARSRAC
jgi:cyanocobalamin reductase (cyanide-eliminating) / alkylcobalamin dealkylase